MARILLIGLGLVSVVAASGCGLSSTEAAPKLTPWFANKSVRVRNGQAPTPEQEAIIRLLDEGRQQLQGGFRTLAPTSNPSAVAAVVGDHAGHLESRDTGALPKDFRLAHTRSFQAWRQLHAILKRFPDSYTGTEFMDNLQMLFQGNDVRGRSLGGDVIEAVGRVCLAHDELYLAAERHGLTPVDEK